MKRSRIALFLFMATFAGCLLAVGFTGSRAEVAAGRPPSGPDFCQYAYDTGAGATGFCEYAEDVELYDDPELDCYELETASDAVPGDDLPSDDADLSDASLPEADTYADDEVDGVLDYSINEYSIDEYPVDEYSIDEYPAADGLSGYPWSKVELGTDEPLAPDEMPEEVTEASRDRELGAPSWDEPYGDYELSVDEPAWPVQAATTEYLTEMVRQLMTPRCILGMPAEAAAAGVEETADWELDDAGSNWSEEDALLSAYTAYGLRDDGTWATETEIQADWAAILEAATAWTMQFAAEQIDIPAAFASVVGSRPQPVTDLNEILADVRDWSVVAAGELGTAVWSTAAEVARRLGEMAGLPGYTDGLRQAQDPSVRTRTSLRTPWRLDL